MTLPDPVYIIYLSGFLFAVGITVLVTKRTAIFMLIGIELMLNAANLNLVFAGAYLKVPADAQIFVMFTIVIAAAEAAVGLAIILKVFRHFQTVYLGNINKLKG